MKTEMKPTGDLYDKGFVLLEAAKDYWDEYQKTGNHDAVIWLQDEDGSLMAFTRGEYTQELKNCISELV